MAVAEQSTTYDFVAETKGRCFLCSVGIYNRSPPTRLESTEESFSRSSSVYSLHCLSRYLKLDMRKVFTGDGPIPSHLEDRVKKSRLKVELCSECKSVIETFSEQFRQLEKIEMEISSSLKIIHWKLKEATDSDKRKDKRPYNLHDGNLEDEWIAKLEIAEALRNDTLEKCSRKLLDNVLPLTRLEKLSRKQIDAEKFKIFKSNASRYIKIYGDENESIGSPPPSVPTFTEDSGNFMDDTMPSTLLPYSNYIDEQQLIKEEPTEMQPCQYLDESFHDDLEMKAEAVSETYQTSSNNKFKNEAQQKLQKPQATKKTTDMQELSQSIPPPIKVTGGGGKLPNAIKNPKTGKFQCPVCSREYARRDGFQFHYKSAHLKVRYKCSLCEKDFSFRQPYETHYLSVHMGVRFKCSKCNKTFSQKGMLKMHQNKC